MTYRRTKLRVPVIHYMALLIALLDFWNQWLSLGASQVPVRSVIREGKHCGDSDKFIAFRLHVPMR